ncbi:hypothetical protein CH295_04365 [Rhodococcus sp. 14-2483-1-2]|nr:hypothetical protein CH295_04365 [Rhodococcus sp. 14-2483-1-2]
MSESTAFTGYPAAVNFGSVRAADHQQVTSVDQVHYAGMRGQRCEGGFASTAEISASAGLASTTGSSSMNALSQARYWWVTARAWKRLVCQAGYGCSSSGEVEAGVDHGGVGNVGGELLPPLLGRPFLGGKWGLVGAEVR